MALKEVPLFSPQALEMLEKHNWPGNVRELKNTVERAVYRTDGGVIFPDDLDFDLSGLRLTDSISSTPPVNESAALKSVSFETKWPLAEGEFDALLAARARELFDGALTKARFNQKEAARLLGMTYHRFRSLRRKFYDPTDEAVVSDFS